MAKRKPITMDRVGQITKKINDEWTIINQKLDELTLILKSEALKDIHRELDILRSDYANLITLAQEETYPFMAESNGVKLPEEDE